MVTFTLPSDGANSSLSDSLCFWACLARWANSSSVRNARVPKLAGRCMGMLAKAGHSPCRSGSPHGSLGGVYGFGDCAKAAVAKRNTKRNPLRMCDLLLLLVVRHIGIRPADEQLLPILEGDAAAVGAQCAILRLIALHRDLRAHFE